jgi:hypothetical protein
MKKAIELAQLERNKKLHGMVDKLMSFQLELEHNSQRILQGKIIIVCLIEGGKVHTIKAKHQTIEIKIIYMLDTKVSHKN